jgi:cellobiose phosphorylase
MQSGLPAKRLQHEHSMAALQDETVVLEPGASCRRGFFGWFVPDKPAATRADDAACIDAALALPEACFPDHLPDTPHARPAASLFMTAPLLESLDLDDDGVAAFSGGPRKHEEHDGETLFSFFTPEDTHVVLKAKELSVLRPHGHLLHTGAALVPDESALTSTAWMGGIFHSMVTQGHVSINRFLSTCHGYLGLFRSHGQRVFADAGGGWMLLDMPSAFEMGPRSCRWIYQHAGGVIAIRSTAAAGPHRLTLEIKVTAGPPLRFLICHHIAINGDDGSAAIPATWKHDRGGIFIGAIPDSDVGRRFPHGGFRITPQAGTAIESIGGDEMLYADGIPRNEPYLCLVTAPCHGCGLAIEGELTNNAAPPAEQIPALEIHAPAGSPLAEAAGRIGTIHPWFVHNALVHYLSPRGLEQYSGGGWGTRDVCQGPVELLLSAGLFQPLRDILLRVFAQQNPDGDWPQWFMFFERERLIRPGDSHGDIVYWPLLALAQYLTATGDASLLDANVPFFHADGSGETASIRSHLASALELIGRRIIPGTRLAAYGHGDWNDSLQPARPEMRARLCSAWTVTLNHQTLTALAGAFRVLGEAERAREFADMAEAVLTEFRRLLVVDGVVTGLADFHEDGGTGYLLHPRDTSTGLSYSLLPMIHAIINDMFTPDQAQAHLTIIRNHLTGPDGAHLFDRPLAYHGGPQTHFQRAESASYFGREVGIMYMHAHLRYCEALARTGDAEAFFSALCLANPVGMRALVPSAAPRQANCYHSSSDPAFADRYEAFAQYDRVARGEVALEGGWRVYSSGPGICVRLITRCFLGISVERDTLVVDPVIPRALDGLEAVLHIAGRRLEVGYRIQSRGHGPLRIMRDGAELPFTRETNPYRMAGARIPLAALDAAPGGRLTVWLG